MTGQQEIFLLISGEKTGIFKYDFQRRTDTHFTGNSLV